MTPSSQELESPGNPGRFNLSFSLGQSSRTATLAQSVNTSKSWLIYNFKSDSGTVTNIGQKLVRGEITNGTTLTFDRDNTGQNLDLTWFLVQFADATLVQHENQSFTTGETQKDVTITSVAISKSIAAGGFYGRGGKSPYSADDNPGVGWFTLDLTSSTNLRITRATTGSSTADIYWSVVEFCSAGEVIVSESGTQTLSMGIPSTDQYVGGKFIITDNIGSRNVTGITITESGTVDGLNDLDNIKLFYELDTSAPYDGASESYGGGESQFGSTDTTGFSAADGTSAFAGSVGISTTATMVVYVVFDVGAGATNGETVEISIEDPSTEVTVDSGGGYPESS